MILKRVIEFFLNHKSLNHLLFIFLIVIATFSYDEVAKEMFPPSSLDKVVLSGYYNSSNSELLDVMIVQDCEEILKANPNIANINTVITKGTYHINADILNQHKAYIVNELQSKIATLDASYPQDFKLPTVKTLSQVFPLISLSLYKKEDNQLNIIDIAKNLKDDIAKIQYIYEVDLVGDYDKSLRLIINHKKLQAYGLSSSKAINALHSSYLISPTGVLQTQKEYYFINPKSSKITKQEILDAKIKIEDIVIYVKDFATLETVYENHSLTTRTDAKNSVVINIKKAKKGDSLEISQEIRKIIQTYEKQYPKLGVKVLSDSSFWIKTRLNVVSSNIIIGLILLFFAIWLFISLKIALVVIVGIPVSFAFGIIGLNIFDYSLNTLSMIGVLLTLGLLVDEAIVVSENIHRHRLLGKSLYQASLDGTYELMPTLFVAAATTIIAFLPLITLSGGLGVFIKIIPLMVIVLVISSFLESFVFLPAHYMLVNKFSKEQRVDFRDKICLKLSNYYLSVLSSLIKYKYLFIASLVILIVSLTVLLSTKAKFILFPEFDAMSINITAKVEHNSLKYTSQESKVIENILIDILDTQNYGSLHTTVGMKTDGRSLHEKANNFFTITINLKPKIADDYFNAVINPYFQLFGSNEIRTRVLTAKEIKKKINAHLKMHQEKYDLIIKIPQTGVVKNDIEISLSAKNNDLIHTSIQEIESLMHKIEGLDNIENNMKFDDTVLEFNLNNYGKSLGFTQSNLSKHLQKYFTKQDITKITTPTNETIELQLSSFSEDTLEDFTSISVHIPNTSVRVSILDITNTVYTKKISTIRKENLQEVFTITASLDKKLSSSKLVYKELSPLIEDLRDKGMDIYIKGEAGKNKQVQEEITKSLLFAFFGILLILTWFFNSFSLAVFSLSVIPLSFLGVLLGHFIMSLPLTFSSMLGFVGLIGIIMNDTLLMLQFIQKSKSTEDLILSASLRLRPILLTSVTTILGLSTLIFFASGESLLMQPLAVSIGFGLIWSTIINLFYLPVSYSFRNN